MRILLLLLVGALASGCLRQRFDLCAQNPPHPECLLDAGPIDAAIDANRDAAFDAAVDAVIVADAFTVPDEDAFAPPDAFTVPDADSPDAFTPPDAP